MFELKQVRMEREINAFVEKFELGDRAILKEAYYGGVSIEEMKELGIIPDTRLSNRIISALRVRYLYKRPQEVAIRMVTEPFSDRQLSVIMQTLLSPFYDFPSKLIMKEILYASNSEEEIISWVNERKLK